MSALYRILLYAFPFLLILVEWIIRSTAEKRDVRDFLAPSIAAAALPLLIPLLEPKDAQAELIDPELVKRIPANHTLRSKSDERVIGVTLFALGIGFVVWALILRSSIVGDVPLGLPSELYGFRTPILASGVLYFMAAMMTEVKTRV